jgi:molybdopterin molybdotransferase
MEFMFTYAEALDATLRHARPLKAKALPLSECLGLVLAKDLPSPEAFPSFDNSAVDGYAIGKGEYGESPSRLKIQGEVAAGKFPKGRIQPGRAVRVFTGAPIPRGTRAVVMQEQTERINGSVLLRGEPKPGENIRYRGEDFLKGRILVRKGTLLTPAHLSLLAAVGYTKAPVFRAPTVGIFATGSELLGEGEKLKPGKIRDSNSILLESLAKQAGGIPCLLKKAGDEPRKILSRIRSGLKNDLLIISGGVSVGKYDFVKEALRRVGVRQIFWKVDIKPGKPLFFGKKGKTLVFGLPGNPVSVFVTFEEFVKRAILQMKGLRRNGEGSVCGYLTHGFKNGSRLHFVRVRCVAKKGKVAVTPLKGQGSHMIGELASANGLLRVEPDASLKRSEPVFVKRIG